MACMWENKRLLWQERLEISQVGMYPEIKTDMRTSESSEPNERSERELTVYISWLLLNLSRQICHKLIS
jgi:hypothetical protein